MSQPKALQFKVGLFFEKKTPRRALRNDRNWAASYGFIGNFALAPMPQAAAQ
jgi:hypothetical protein